MPKMLILRGRTFLWNEFNICVVNFLHGGIYVVSTDRDVPLILVGLFSDLVWVVILV